MRLSAGWRDDRGLHYGDGLFETVRFVAGRAPLWDWHIERLCLGCARLGLPQPDASALARRAARAARVHASAVVKLIFTAGGGPRGYARPQPMAGRAYIDAQAWTPSAQVGLRVRWCETRLALQPALAGIKHLNRLEQVLARSEWLGTSFDEGLMLDMRGQVAAATAANVFVRIDGRWRTPPVAECGVAGVGRRWLMRQVGAVEAPIGVDTLMAAETCVLTNAVRGPRWLRTLADREWMPDPEVEALVAAWDALFGAPP